ncbi:MAG: DUF4276 family protein [Methylocystis sp.]
MRQIVVLTEEDSARIVVEHIASSRGLSDRVKVIPHEGKSDLEASIPRKIGHWRASDPPRFIILRDNDGSNCSKLKSRLHNLVPNAAHDRVKIRIVMHELESWYLGDLAALAAAGLVSPEKAEALTKKAKLRNPERLTNAKQEFRRLVMTMGQIELANRIGPFLDADRCRSKSFRQFLEALSWAAS